MQDNNVKNNFEESLKQKYNAVCFDIDGTLTEKNSKKIDHRAIKMIINLLVRKIPVVFITGRGESGLKDFISDIIDDLNNHNEITEDDIKRIYVLTNDGARLFYSSKISNEKFLNESVYLCSDDSFEHLLSIDKIVKENFNHLINASVFKVTYSKDLSNGKTVNIRIVFNDLYFDLSDDIYESLRVILKKCEYFDLSLSRGFYKGCPVIQIGTTTKDKAIQITEKIIGVPQNSMIRIGDCGDLKGNDYSMLNCPQGYSVDKTSGEDGKCFPIFDENGKCFPIFDENGEVIKGVDATLYLIKKSNILPTVCLEKVDRDKYIYEFAQIERKIVLGRKKLLMKYNNLISKNFNSCYEIDNIFDGRSGSVIIPMYEMELLNDNPLKKFWLSMQYGNLTYSLRDNNCFLLRGSSTYYYFLANRMNSDDKDFTSKRNVIEWNENYISFLRNAINAVILTKNINDETNKKMLLGIIDNCRNILLILINNYLMCKYVNDNIILDLSCEKNDYCINLYNVLLNVEKEMSNLCFNSEHIICKEHITSILNNTYSLLETNLFYELNNNLIGDYSKYYRAYREIDNFAENFIAVSLYKENCLNRSEKSCGLSYGGIELPFISKIVDDKVDQLFIMKFNKKMNGYTNKQLLDLRNFNINDCNGIINKTLNDGSSLDIFDDNILTGKTLQLTINSLYDSNIKVNNICIVRYPSINRIDQMFINTPSAIDYRLFFNYIYGLCFDSPYSWKDNSWKNKNGKINYTDSLGVFDINRSKILEVLLKNHDYSENSEVNEYKRRLLK